MPLHLLINTPKAVDMLNSLVDVFRHDGWLPDSRCVITYDGLQNGTNADVLFADAYAKKVAGIDYDTALLGMIKDADTPSPDTVDFGRDRVSEYLAKGYVSTVTRNPVSKTLEYVYDDYCVLKLCEGLRKTAEAERYRKRMQWYKNVWDDSIGFMRGRKEDGSWITPFDPKETFKISRGPSFYEGNAYQWSYYAPHDNKGLIGLYGGEEEFVKRLDDMCVNHYDVSNEPDMLNPYLF